MMNSYYTEKELKQFGFKKIGENILVSRKASIYGAENISIDNNTRIDDFCILSGNINIGSYVHIAAYTALYGGENGIFIEHYVNLSSRISIYSICDDFSGETMTNPLIPMKYKNITSKAVYIEKHVIVGSASIILPGITLKEGGSFGCFSLINHSTEPWSIYAGIPIHKIKERSKDLLRLETLFDNERNK